MKKMIKDSRNIMGRYEARTRAEMIQLMDDEIAELPEEQRESAHFEIQEYGYAYDNNAYHALFMNWERPETDEEEKTREDQEAALKTQQAARDRAEFLRLKKQFGE